jgi:hypothetical protein
MIGRNFEANAEERTPTLPRAVVASFGESARKEALRRRRCVHENPGEDQDEMKPNPMRGGVLTIA